MKNGQGSFCHVQTAKVSGVAEVMRVVMVIVHSIMDLEQRQRSWYQIWEILQHISNLC